MPKQVGRVHVICVGMLLAVLFAGHTAQGHDIPVDVTAQILVKPVGDKLHVLVRVPLKAMRDVDFPELGTGYLDLDQIEPLLRDAASLWIGNEIEIYEGDARLPNPRVAEVRASLQSDRSFTSYELALAHLTGPRLSNGTQLFWDQAMLDALFEYPIRSNQSRFSIHPGLGRLGERVVIALRFELSNGTVRAYEFMGDPGLIHLDPRWFQASKQFVELGFFHILGGIDHLLFLFCLVIPFRSFRALLPVVTAFTVAHSITLAASAYNLAPSALWFPPLIEALIAISILYMALENIVGTATVQRRWVVAFAFGLVHGFGFSFALKQTLQFAGSHLLASLLSFNIGVELGQILMLCLFIPALEAAFRFVVAERVGTIILSTLVAHTAWHWMIERANVLSQYRFVWPPLAPAFLATATHYLMVAVILAGLVWLYSGVLRHLNREKVNKLWSEVRPRKLESSGRNEPNALREP